MSRSLLNGERGAEQDEEAAPAEAGHDSPYAGMICGAQVHFGQQRGRAQIFLTREQECVATLHLQRILELLEGREPRPEYAPYL